MSKHLWMQDLTVAAYCPKCSDINFKRSNTRSGFERLVRRYSNKVPYRCHSCGFRTLIDPTYLRYPASAQSEYTDHEDFSSEIEIPGGTLGSIMANSKEKGKSGKEQTAQSGEKPAKNIPEQSDTASDIPKRDDKGFIDSGGTEAVEARDRSDVDNMFPDFVNESEPPPGMQPLRSRHRQAHPAACPSCGEKALHRSHSRSALETILKKITKKRPYRCHKCNWRGWLQRHS